MYGNAIFIHVAVLAGSGEEAVFLLDSLHCPGLCLGFGFVQH